MLKPTSVVVHNRPPEWIIVDGDKVVFQTSRCQDACDHIRQHGLPAGTLYRASRVAEMTAKRK